jgi:hypothetical protein
MDDWESKYWAKKQQQMQQQGRPQAPRNPQDLPHFEPAHITQDKQRATNPGNGWRDVDPLTAMYTNMDGMASRGMGTQHQAVMVRPGAKYYKAVQADSFGTTMPLVRMCGAYNENVTREFEMLSECRCYVIDNLQQVDLSKMEPGRMVELVQVRAPFVGTILVEKSSIVGAGSSGGPQILKG